jgi:hypothetical protein
MMGFASLYPSYGLTSALNRFTKFDFGRMGIGADVTPHSWPG